MERKAAEDAQRPVREAKARLKPVIDRARTLLSELAALSAQHGADLDRLAQMDWQGLQVHYSGAVADLSPESASDIRGRALGASGASTG
jgi:hypothetical protein